MTEIDAEQELSRDEIAEYLHEFARQLQTSGATGQQTSGTERGDDRVTFMVGNESTTVNPPERVGFTVAVDSDSSILDTGPDHEVEFRLAWQAEEVEQPEGDERLEIR